MCIRDHFSSLLGPYGTIVLFFLTSRKNTARPKGHAFEASHEEAQVSSGHPKRPGDAHLTVSIRNHWRRLVSHFFQVQVLFQVNALFFGALFQSDLAPCFKSNQRPCSSINVFIDIYIYIHKYIHTNSNVYIYIYVDQYIYIFSYTSVFAVLHMYTHIHTHV